MKTLNVRIALFALLCWSGAVGAQAPVLTSCPPDLSIDCTASSDPLTGTVATTTTGVNTTTVAVPDNSVAGLMTTATVSGIPPLAVITDIRISNYKLDHTWVGWII